MLTRRQLLQGATVTLLLIPACGSSDSGGSAPVASGCSGTSSTSSPAAGHTHELCVPAGDLDTPPASGQTYTTTLNAGHTHSVTLSSTQLEDISRGTPVSIESTTTDGHAHAFTIQKVGVSTPMPVQG